MLKTRLDSLKEFLEARVRKSEGRAQNNDMEREALVAEFRVKADPSQEERHSFELKMKSLDFCTAFRLGEMDALGFALDHAKGFIELRDRSPLCKVSYLEIQLEDARKALVESEEAIEWAREAGWSPDEEEGVRDAVPTNS